MEKEEFYMYKGSTYTEKPKFTEIVDYAESNSAIYYTVKKQYYIPHIILLCCIFLVIIAILNTNEIQHKVAYNTVLHCKDGQLQLNMVNDKSNTHDVVIRIYNSKEIICDDLLLKPGESVGNISIQSVETAGVSNMYTLDYKILGDYRDFIERFDVLVVFE